MTLVSQSIAKPRAKNEKKTKKLKNAFQKLIKNQFKPVFPYAIEKLRVLARRRSMPYLSFRRGAGGAPSELWTFN